MAAKAMFNRASLTHTNAPYIVHDARQFASNVQLNNRKHTYKRIFFMSQKKFTKKRRLLRTVILCTENQQQRAVRAQDELCKIRDSRSERCAK